MIMGFASSPSTFFSTPRSSPYMRWIISLISSSVPSVTIAWPKVSSILWILPTLTTMSFFAVDSLITLVGILPYGLRALWRSSSIFFWICSNLFIISECYIYMTSSWDLSYPFSWTCWEYYSLTFARFDITLVCSCVIWETLDLHSALSSSFCYFKSSLYCSILSLSSSSI